MYIQKRENRKVGKILSVICYVITRTGVLILLVRRFFNIVSNWKRVYEAAGKVV